MLIFGRVGTIRAIDSCFSQVGQAGSDGEAALSLDLVAIPIWNHVEVAEWDNPQAGVG